VYISVTKQQYNTNTGELKKMMAQESLYVMGEIPLQGTQSKSRMEVFEELVLGAVDECFSSFGESCKQSIYFHLKECCNINRAEIPSRISEFTGALEESFGPGGKLIEIGIMKALYGKTQNFKYFPDQENLSFASYVENLRHFL
jgi:hypothetical protein